MNIVERVTFWVVTSFATLAILSGLFALSVPALVLGSALLLAAMGFRGGMVRLNDVKENSEDVVALLIRIAGSGQGDVEEVKDESARATVAHD